MVGWIFILSCTLFYFLGYLPITLNKMLSLWIPKGIVTFPVFELYTQVFFFFCNLRRHSSKMNFFFGFAFFIYFIYVLQGKICWENHLSSSELWVWRTNLLKSLETFNFRYFEFAAYKWNRKSKKLSLKCPVNSIPHLKS